MAFPLSSNKGLVAIEQDATTVTATVTVFRDGVPTDEKEVVVAQYLIESDGAKGIVILHLEAASNDIIYTGNSRKLLGLTFQGETRDAAGMVWGDVTIKGLTSEERWCCCPDIQMIPIFLPVLAYLGETWTFYVGCPHIYVCIHILTVPIVIIGTSSESNRRQVRHWNYRPELRPYSSR